MSKIAPEGPTTTTFTVKDDDAEEVIVVGGASSSHIGHKLLRAYLRRCGGNLLFIGAFIAMLTLNIQPLQLYEMRAVWERGMSPYISADSVRDATDFWNFMNNGIASKVLLQDSSKGNTWSRGNVLVANRVRVRQLRVTSTTCPLTTIAVDGVTTTCYPTWSASSEATTFTPSITVDSLATTWSDASGDPVLSTKYNVYPASGFTVDVSSSASALSLFSSLQSGGWIDTATRAVIISFAFYHPSAGGYVAAYCIFEFVSSGLVRPYIRVAALPASPFLLSGNNLLWVLMQLVVAASTVFYAGRLGVQVLTEGFGSIGKRGVWAMMEIVQISVVFAMFVLRLVIYIKSSALDASFPISPGDIIRLSFWYEHDTHATGVAIVFTFVKFIELAKALPQCYRVIVALETAAFHFAIGIGVLFLIGIGYALMGMILFGSMISAYSTLADSYGSLLAALVGNMDWNTLMDASPMLAGPFIFSWLLICALSILSASAGAVIGAMQNLDETRNNRNTVSESVLARMHDLRRSRAAVAGLAQKLSAVKNADLDGDGVVDRGELETAIRAAGLEHTKAEELFSQFDKDNSGGLDEDELRAMQDHLLGQQKLLAQQLDLVQRQTEITEMNGTNTSMRQAANLQDGPQSPMNHNSNMSPAFLMQANFAGEESGTQAPAVARQVDRVERQLQKLAQNLSGLGEKMESVLSATAGGGGRGRGGVWTPSGPQGHTAPPPQSAPSGEYSPRLGTATPLGHPSDTPASSKRKKNLKFQSSKIVVE